MPKLVRLVLRPLIGITVLLLILELIGAFAFSHDEEQLAWSANDISSIARNRLTAVRLDLDSASQLFLRDPFLLQAIDRYSTVVDVLPHLDRDVRAWQHQSPDSLRGYGVIESRDTLPYGVAVYNPQGRLLAWQSNRPGVFSFDTVLSAYGPLEKKSRLLVRENGPIYTHLAEYRKITNREGIVSGYLEVKRQLAARAPLGATVLSNTTYLDDLKSVVRREFVLDFHPNSPLLRDDTYWKSLLYADKEDSASFVGLLAISKTTLSDQPTPLHFLQQLRKLSSSAIIVVLFLWGVIVLIALREDKRPLVARIVRSAIMIVLLIAARYLLYLSDGFSVLVGQQFQDTWGFGSDLGGGILRNPLELFITCLLASLGCMLLWLIWMPRRRLVAEDSTRSDIIEVVRRETPLLLGFSVASIILVVLLTGSLSIIIQYLLENSGSIRYLSVRQVLPSPTVLMMYLSFLNLGVAYLFLGALFFTFALRAIIFIISRRYSLKQRLTFGSLIFSALVLAIGYFFYPLMEDGFALWYLIASLAALLVISISVIVADTFIRDTVESDSPSLLYRLPRSSRSVLFILAASAMLVSPLIAQKEERTNMDVAENIIRKNAEIDETFLANEVARALESAQSEITSTNGVREASPGDGIKQTAFIVWLSAFADHPEWDALIDIVDGSGTIVSHFATSGGVEQASRLRTTIDSQLVLLLKNSNSTSAIHSIPCFTASCQPLVWGTKQVAVISQAQKQAPQQYKIVASVWSDLPTFNSSRQSFELLRAQKEDEESSSQLITEGGFVLAQYRPGMKRTTNAPALDVPATLPNALLRRLMRVENVWARTYINRSPYQTLFHRLGVQAGSHDNIPTVVAVSVPEPGFLRVVEFGLRLNAIGLLYGISIALVLLILRQASVKRIRFVLKFRDRIFLIVLTIALLPLVIVTNVTRNLLEERALSEERDRVARDASVITDRIGRRADSAHAIQFAGLQSMVSDLSQTVGRNFNVYDAKGYLRASSSPELYESTIISDELNPAAVREILIGRKSFFSDLLQVGSQLYQVGYQPINSSRGDALLGIISVATIQERARIEADIARTTSLIYGTFAALGLILLGIGALFAARVAKPIVTLIDATQRVAQGKLHTSIPVNRDDEIGELMHAFNAMTGELDKSREIVAQTERELAWKEMARQVAHEIKNPLTPMKLSVQHLEHAHEAKDSNFNAIFRRVIRTLGEQIDVLTRIATEFSRFGEMPRRKYGPVSVRTVAESAVALFDAERHRIRFIIDVPKQLSFIHADEEEFRRTLVNLIRNAIQAIEGWGVIVVRATEDRGMIHIKLSDTGSGMSEETLRKAFDPNFSTKTSGMGLGLAIVKKTITDMSGTITVESAIGRGTTFFIDLPAREGPIATEQDE